MLHTRYYLIESRELLKNQLQSGFDKGMSEILTEPLLILNEEADRSSWGKDENILKVKLLYLARMREYEFISSDEDAIKVLGSDNISGPLFDKWWTIREIEVEGNTEELIMFLKPLKNRVKETGNKIIDSWIREYI